MNSRDGISRRLNHRFCQTQLDESVRKSPPRPAALHSLTGSLSWQQIPITSLSCLVLSCLFHIHLLCRTTSSAVKTQVIFVNKTIHEVSVPAYQKVKPTPTIPAVSLIANETP
jgi:hypothetical protein